MHVRHFMTPNPVACETTDSIQQAARLMRDKNIGFLVVLRKGKVAGIVTDRQLATEALATGVSPANPVEKVMTADPATVTLDDNLFSVIDTLRSAGVVRRVPVVNGQDQLVGVVSISDIAVIAKDLIDAVLLEDTRHALVEARLPTGGKRMADALRSPASAAAEHGPSAEVHPVTASSARGRRTVASPRKGR